MAVQAGLTFDQLMDYSPRRLELLAKALRRDRAEMALMQMDGLANVLAAALDKKGADALRKAYNRLLDELK